MFTSKPNGVAFQMDHEHPSASTYCQMILTRLKPKNSRPSKSLMQRPDTSVNPKAAAMRLNINWDFAEEFEEADAIDDPEVPAAVGYGSVLGLSAFSILIGISVVLIVLSEGYSILYLISSRLLNLDGHIYMVSVQVKGSRYSVN